MGNLLANNFTRSYPFLWHVLLFEASDVYYGIVAQLQDNSILTIYFLVFVWVLLRNLLCKVFMWFYFRWFNVLLLLFFLKSWMLPEVLSIYKANLSTEIKVIRKILLLRLSAQNILFFGTLTLKSAIISFNHNIWMRVCI